MKRITIVIAVVVILCGAGYGVSQAVAKPGLVVTKVGWDRSAGLFDFSVNENQPCKVAGELWNNTTATYSWVEIVYGVYDARTRRKIAVVVDWTVSITPGEHWQFKCMPPLPSTKTMKAESLYYYRLMAIYATPHRGNVR